MKPFFWNLADWCVLAIIVWAHDMNTTTAERLLDAASVWVGIVNALAILHLITLFFYKEARLQLKEQTSSWNRLETINFWMNFFTGLVIFAWAGWIFTFGVRIIYVFLSTLKK